jgi:colanic acid biosynthesis glycosyl transferase WcaI
LKILLYGINFAPEPLGVGRYTGEMAQMLNAAGHEVRVVTALPYYPEWKVSPNYSKWSYVTETFEGMKVFRAPLWVPHFPKGQKRILHLITFAITSLPLMIRQWTWKPDLVWMAAPSIMCAPAALLTARVCGAKAWIHVQDFETDIAFGLGVISGGWVRRTVDACESWLLSRFERVSTISKGMMARALAKGVKENVLVSCPNWVDLDQITISRGPSPYRAELGIPDDAVVALYSGTMGIKQAVDWLAEAAVRLADVPNLMFVFCGDGQMKAGAQAMCGHLPSVRFVPLQPLERLSDLLALADIHLLPQRPGAGSMVMPSKLTGMLASGRPVVAMSEAGTELTEVVGTCGKVVEPGDVPAFADAVLSLSTEPELRAQLGRIGREFAKNNLSARSVLARVESEMQSLVGNPHVTEEFT